MKINVKNKHIQEWGASELGKLLDLYWGGSERRITKLTLKILGINLIALLVFIILINYLGQYHNQIIQARLEMFDREAKLISVSLVESNLLDEQGRIINEENLSRFIRVLDISSGKKLSIYARDGSIEGRFRGSNFLV
nr:sensor N-terminal transmembrane domain-containing protein [Micavibrio sp.]